MTSPGEKPIGTVDMDDFDRQIMKLLRPDARRSCASIARAIGVSEPTVRNRVTRLIKGGAILRWARVNAAAIGFPVDAMVGISVKQGHSKRVGAMLAQMVNVAYVAYTTGSFDILIEAHLADNEGLFRFLNEDLEAFEDVGKAPLGEPRDVAAPPEPAETLAV